MNFKNSFYFGLLITFLASCAAEKSTVPAYLNIPKVIFDGSNFNLGNTHGITDVWINGSGNLFGVY